MTKDVLICIAGTQFDTGDEPVELMVRGSYYLKNGKHYVLYEEQAEANGPVTKNTVKFYDGYFEMTKRGSGQSYLMFERGKQTSTVYQTVAGSVQVDIATQELEISETENEIGVYVKYALDINYQFVSQCEVHFTIKAQ